MLTDLLEGRRCLCGGQRFSRLWADETPERLSFVILCENCGHISRTTYSDTTRRTLLANH